MMTGRRQINTFHAAAALYSDRPTHYTRSYEIYNSFTNTLGTQRTQTIQHSTVTHQA